MPLPLTLKTFVGLDQLVCCNLVMKNQTGRGRRCQHVLVVCAIVQTGNIDDYFLECNCVFVIVLYVCTAQTSVVLTLIG